jgi:HEAT repeat protein
LGNIADARAVEPLINALSDPDDAVRNAAAKALNKIDNQQE